ncbi:MAG: glycoside hydrolase family 99-like domain-containing protein [Oscillospiraceae bacterium]|nr:glycoside hydrolase family 99-like domain-containing protein [Oscillospiraceae bacterium]
MKHYDVGAYIWPAYTGDELRSRMFWPKGMGEWETVQEAKPKYEGHQWPRRPLWGYVNEADPAVMEMEIAQATRHGVNVFIYDWYWFDRRPFLECCLNDGFLKAANNKEMQFYLMWANHDANHLWDRRLSGSECGRTTIWTGRVNRIDFEEMAERLVDKYFGLDNYYRIDGKPVFMIYDLGNFIAGLGGEQAAIDAIAWLRALAVKKGFPGLHLQTRVRSAHRIKKSADGLASGGIEAYPPVVRALGIDSVTHYGFGDMAMPQGDYLTILEEVACEYAKMEQDYDAAYFPQVACGWDNNPRFPDTLRPRIITNNTPENFEKALRLAKTYVDEHPLPAPLITINAWNEWTETSYLQPDDLYGYGYLDAVKKVFVDGQ